MSNIDLDYDGDCRWYMTAAAVRMWLGITGREDDDGGVNWGIAEQELGQLAEHATDTGQRTQNGAHVFRVRAKVPGRNKSARVEFTVSMNPRPEGNLPQLLRVRVR